MAVSDQEIQRHMAEAERKVAIANKRLRYWLKEKRFEDDQYRSRNEITEELPPLDQIWRIYMLTWRADGRAVVVRQGRADQPWQVPTLVLSDDDEEASARSKSPKAFDRWLKSTAKELWGVTIQDWYQGARLHLTATSEATDVEPGRERYFVFLCATASKLADIPEGVDWARRAIETKEFVALLREHYYEFDELLDPVHDGYLIKQAQAGR